MCNIHYQSFGKRLENIFVYIAKGKYTHVIFIIQLFTLTNALLGICALVLSMMMLLILLQIDCGAKPGMYNIVSC